MAVRLRFENQFSREMEAKLEMATTLFGFVLRDKLRICCNAVENPFIMGICHAWSFYHPDNYEYKESPQNKWLKNL